MDRQVCVIKTVAYRARTDRQTQGQTDRKVKSEGPKILSNDIFYFKKYDHWRSNNDLFLRTGLI